MAAIDHGHPVLRSQDLRSRCESLGTRSPSTALRPASWPRCLSLGEVCGEKLRLRPLANERVKSFTALPSGAKTAKPVALSEMCLFHSPKWGRGSKKPVPHS